MRLDVDLGALERYERLLGVPFKAFLLVASLNVSCKVPVNALLLSLKVECVYKSGKFKGFVP